MDSSLSTENEIVASIRQIVRAVDMHSRRLVEVFGLTGPQVATLQEVARLGPTPLTVLARAVHLSPGTVSGIVQRLERRDLLQRERSTTDRRTVLLSITDDGQQVLDAAPSLLQDQFREALERLDDWERLMILSTLKRIAVLMGAERIPTEPHLISDTVSLPQGGVATIDANALASNLDTTVPVPPDGIDDRSKPNPLSEAP